MFWTLEEINESTYENPIKVPKVVNVKPTKKKTL